MHHDWELEVSRLLLAGSLVLGRLLAMHYGW